MRRTTAAAEDHAETPTALIDRLSAEYDAAGTAVGHRAARPRRTTVRRLAPLGVGAAVMLVAALVVTLVPQADPVAGPELSSELAAPAVIAPASPTAGGALVPPTGPILVPAPTPRASSVKPRPVAPVAPKPAPLRKPVTTVGDGVQAAAKLGWQLVAGDEFTGSGLSAKWGAYEGAGHDGNGRRVRSAISVAGGMLTIRGDSAGNSGGMAWNDNQKYGKWEVRARFPKGDDNYHPVLLLWPENGWPPEVDFSETTSASAGTSFYLHYGSANQQVSASKKIDITQWHNYAVEWVAGRVTGYVDGQQWFQSTDGKTVPNVPMHLAVQLDNFGGGGMQPTEMNVDYVRIYK